MKVEKTIWLRKFGGVLAGLCPCSREGRPSPSSFCKIGWEARACFSFRTSKSPDHFLQHPGNARISDVVYPADHHALMVEEELLVHSIFIDEFDVEDRLLKNIKAGIKQSVYGHEIARLDLQDGVEHHRSQLICTIYGLLREIFLARLRHFYFVIVFDQILSAGLVHSTIPFEPGL